MLAHPATLMVPTAVLDATIRPVTVPSLPMNENAPSFAATGGVGVILETTPSAFVHVTLTRALFWMENSMPIRPVKGIGVPRAA